MGAAKSVLNYWLLRKPSNWELVGFADISEDMYIGIHTETGQVCPLFVFFNDKGWGDDEPTSTKFPWVLLAEGNDDSSYYMLFGTKKAAVSHAMEFTNGDLVLDVWKDKYKNRSWMGQN